MGFVINDSGFTNELKISWTKIGREYLIGSRPNRKKGLIVKKFALSDVDINYNVTDQDYIDLIPNITGVENRCINGNVVVDQKFLLEINDSNEFNYKNYTITITPSSGRIRGDCNEINLYDLTIDGVSIFNQKIPYSVISNNFNDILFYVKSAYLSNIFLNGNIISLNNIPTDSVVADNSNIRCNNGFNSLISESIINISTPSSSGETINYASINISNRCESSINCSLYYSEYALSSDVKIHTIKDCYVCKFDDFANPC